ncbi:MAG: hypothetical protein LC792_02170 [Actinobacteria bacterium]|nr:hypothetical protein [Actinomycetota bacterium]
MAATELAAPIPTAASAVAVDRLLDDAWTVDCAIRLRQPAWAAASADRLLVDIARYGHHIQTLWAHLDPEVAESLAKEVLTVQLALLTIADQLRSGATWPPADLYERVGRLIHQEAIAVGDTAWGVD